MGGETIFYSPLAENAPGCHIPVGAGTVSRIVHVLDFFLGITLAD